MKSGEIYNRVRHEIECYLKLIFKSKHSQLERENTLESYIDKWELVYYTTYKNLYDSSHNAYNYINESEKRFSYQNLALHVVYVGMCDKLPDDLK